MDEQSINEPTLLGQQLADGEAKLTTKVPQEIISPYQVCYHVKELCF